MAYVIQNGQIVSPAAGITAIGSGVAVNNGTIGINGTVALTGTAAGTVTIAPTSGVSLATLTMPSAGGTVTVAAAPAYPGQDIALTIVQGATAGHVTLNSGFVFGTSPASYTATPTAAAIDMLQLISQDGTHWRVWDVILKLTA